MVGYFCRFTFGPKGRQAHRLECVVVYVDFTGVRMYPPPEKSDIFIAKQGIELVALKGSTINLEVLSNYVSLRDAAKIVARYDKCEEAWRNSQTAWKLFQLVSGELVLAKNFSFSDPLHHLARPTAVLVRRHGVSVHEQTLQIRTPPQESDSVLFVSAKTLTPEVLRRYFSAHEAAEIISLFKLNRDHLLNCLTGGRTACSGP
jgi:hypothetical protein